ncbi:LPS export ABC transporter permease LptF [Glaciimonas sp. Gout2]|uniref:LPS export ABC transporter permease LptF n=1 Tax=unclassified Glaciimonas TaxID=2644401 RepID=UPI002B2252E4|nr:MULTISPECIES: LPS export ABC transporter permease LptF [unclassified Glaciimonas]MEB0010990.1 LPS export ABC transporter permease LptF [Glaciimonas sp. Cout2]MEB0083279.1 LPS export ABC transporter permease LptF [Glaciimonas sp. Gout2]
MIFQRALRRELLSTAGAVFTTLFTITITVMLIKILGQAAGGQIASADVIALIGFQALNYLPIILILTGYISVLLVVTRSYQDSEMVVWFASGLSLTRWIKPVLLFGLPIVVLTALLSFVATPWANTQSAEYRERFEKREDLSKVSPGKFQESSTGNRIFFVEGFSGDSNKVKNVFINTQTEGKNSIVIAKEGTIEQDKKGDKFLILSQGRRYDSVSTQSDFRIMEFERYGTLVASESQALSGDKSSRALPTIALLKTPNNFNMGELLWRMSLPMMALCLMLLAIPLSFVNPRVGRSASLIIALLLFVTYSNMVSFFQATVVQGRLSFLTALWPVHVVVLGLILFLFSWRLKVNSRYHPLVVWSAIKHARILKKSAAS